MNCPTIIIDPVGILNLISCIEDKYNLKFEHSMSDIDEDNDMEFQNGSDS